MPKNFDYIENGLKIKKWRGIDDVKKWYNEWTRKSSRGLRLKVVSLQKGIVFTTAKYML